MGFFDVPTVERKPWGILGLILNIIPTGVGTIVAGVKEGRHVARYVIVGIIQLVVPFLGWLWSIVWGIRIFMASTSSAAGVAAVATAASSDPDHKPQCAALTEDGQQCRNSARGTSRYCASHKGYQPPTAKGLAKRIEGESWSATDKLTDPKSVASADTRPLVKKAPDTRLKVRKSAKKSTKGKAKK